MNVIDQRYFAEKNSCRVRITAWEKKRKERRKLQT